MATAADTASPAPALALSAPHTPRQRLLVAIVALVVMIVLVAPFFREPVDMRAPDVRGGVIDLAGWGPLERPIELDGSWGLHWSGGVAQAPRPADGTVRVPGRWTGQRLPDGTPLPENGIARYELVLHGLRPGTYAMHLPVIWAASRVYLDGKEVSHRGVVGRSAADTRYHLRAQNLTFTTQGGDVALAVEIASFLHRDNGMEDAPVIGLAEPMDNWFALMWSREFLYNISLLLIASLGIAVFLFRPTDRASLYFGLACLTFFPNASVIGFDNTFQLMTPSMTFETSMAIQYLCGYLAAAFFLANPHELFPRESPKPVFRVFVAAYAAFIAIQTFNFLRGDTLGASHVHSYFLGFILVTLVYVVAIVVRATLRGRDGALIFLLGMTLFVGTFMLTVLVTAGWVARDQVPGYAYTAIGVLMMLFSHVTLMAERWALAVARAEKIADEQRQLVEVNTAITSDLELGPLLAKIVQVTSRIIHADRTSLFLEDEHSGELTSLVAEGVGTRQLRFSAGSGLAGHVFATGETLNIADAYADERFNRAVDEETGYVTRSVLTLPIAARDGRRLGVMQALNRLDGQPFDQDDIARMTAFGAQAAVAIDNARLFGEVLDARAFDESILRSMSGGVIALDYGGKVNKINAAAAEIVGRPIGELMGIDARAMLPESEQWISDEVRHVARSGEMRLLLDIELMALRDKPISVNVSIAPLRGEEGNTGILMVLEDISQEKRLQGAMRRFMTQEVVDQVLGRDDEPLFGTACDASVLFADIRGFTTLAEQLSARETVEMLNELFTEMFEAVAGAGGVLDKYIGDAIMAVYGAPLSSGQDAVNAVTSGAEMLRLLDLINARREGRGAQAMRLGIGIASGEVVAGTIGSPKRMDYTVIGDSVNLAARLQELTKTYGVEMLIDETTAARVGDRFGLREVDLIRVRGRQRPAKVFEVLARDPGDVHARAALLDAYRDGRAALVGGDWAGAVAAFGRAHLLDAADMPSRLMLERARALAAQPPASGWDGVWHGPAKVAS